MSANKRNSNKRKPNIPNILLKYSLVIAAVITTCGTIIAAFIGYMAIRYQSSFALNTTQTVESEILTLSPNQVPSLPTPTQKVVIITPAPLDTSDVAFPVPTIGAQLDFSPESDNFNADMFRRSPFNGIFMSETEIERYAPSWIAIYSDGTKIKAESDVCLMNLGAFAPSAQTGPLNIKTSRISFYFAIYSDYRYSYDIQDIEVFVTKFIPMNNDIVSMEIGIPGAGGWTYPFNTVQAIKVWVEGLSNTMYKMDFKDFLLGPNNGVNIFLPVAMIDAGYYQFILKVNGVATPTYAGDPAGKLSLTSNVLDYEWVQVNDPRDYEIAEKDGVEIILEPCP